MFENNNGAIIKKLAQNTKRKDHRLNTVSTIMIVLSVAISFAAALFTMSVVHVSNTVAQQVSQVDVNHVTEAVVRELQQDRAFSKVGASKWIDDFSAIDYSVTTEYQDANYISGMGKIVEGRMPENNNEVLLDVFYAKRLNTKIGETVTLKIQGQESRYTVTGLIKDIKSIQTDTEQYSVIVAKSFLRDNSEAMDSTYDASVNFPNGTRLTTEEISQKMSDIRQRYHLNEENVVPGRGYFTAENNFSIRFSQIGLLLGLTIFIFIAAAIVIHSIFYISISEKTRQYGQLRTIGTTKKQTMKLVRSIALSFLKAGLPIGLLIGGIGGYLIAPSDWYWPYTLIAAAVVICVSSACVVISVSAPAKQAANVSPIEAVQYTAYQPGRYKKVRKSRHKITPFALAKMDFSRDKRKAASTVVSLAIGGILFVIVSGLSMSYNPGNYIQKYNYPHGGSYAVSVESGKTAAETQTIEKTIRQVSGVKSVYPIYSAYDIHAVADGAEQNLNVMFCSESDFDLLSSSVLEGSIRYDQLVNENGVVVRKGSFNENCRVGDLIRVNTGKNDSSAAETVKFLAVVDSNSTVLGLDSAPALIFPADTKSGISTAKELARIEVVSDSSTKAEVGTKLQSLVNSSKGLKLSSFQADAKSVAAPRGSLYAGLQILAVFIAIFGLVNYLNTTITNFYARRREIGILQAAGTTKKQVKRIFLYEGLFYLAGMLSGMLMIGTLGLCLIVTALNRVSVTYTFSFPFLPVALFTTAVLVIQLLVTAYIMRALRKETLVECIAGNE